MAMLHVYRNLHYVEVCYNEVKLYCNDPKSSDRQALTNRAETDKSIPRGAV